MQFQVPQFIETEDKVVGPFTLRQFFYVAFASGFSFILYFTVAPWLWVLLSAFLLGAALALGFLKINGRPFLGFLTSAFTYYWNPQTYVWRPENPRLGKEEEFRGAGGEKLLENLVSGLVLKNTWRSLQTGAAPQKPREERYEIFQRASGERQAARRIDYR